MEIILQGNSAEVLFIIAIIVVTQTKLPALLCTCNSVKFHSEMLLKKKSTSALDTLQTARVLGCSSFLNVTKLNLSYSMMYLKDSI